MHHLPYHIAILSTLYLSANAATNYSSCLDEFKGRNLTSGGVDNFGHPVSNAANAVGITYELCLSICGPGQKPFNWTTFSQQFSSWLLPWVSLVSQLPFYGGTRSTNLESVILTVGSPALAGYSLALTVLNSRWVYRRFNSIKYPNRNSAARALSSLQQVPLRVVSENGLLASLIVLPENDPWWEDLVERLDCSYTWNIANATNIAWVVVAFLLTVIDSYKSLNTNIDSDGRGIGILWMWLLSIIVGWMQVPITSHEKLLRTLKKTSETAYVAVQDVDEEPKSAEVEETPCDKAFRRGRNIPGTNTPCTAIKVIPASHVPGDSALCMWKREEPNYRDESKTSPIFNYTRSWGWADAVEEVATAFEEASNKAKNRKPVDPNNKWIHSSCKGNNIDPANRTGSLNQIQEYCGYSSLGIVERKRIRTTGALTRAIIASLCGLALQWGTTVSSVLLLIYTPTVGLGCRSGTHVLYGILSTLVLLLMITSSMLNHYCSINSPDNTLRNPRTRSSFDSISVASIMSNVLRCTGILIASVNSLWLIIACLFQFANIFDTCYCNSNVITLGSARAYCSIAPDWSHTNTRGFWIVSMVMGGSCTVAYTMFVALMVEPPASNSK